MYEIAPAMVEHPGARPIPVTEALTMYSTTKTCRYCNQVLPVSQFSMKRSEKDGLCAWCKPCGIVRIRAWREGHKEHERRWRQQYYMNNQEYFRARRQSREAKARLKLNKAVFRGKIIRPDRCPICGTTESRIEAHHEDYSQPLEVQWACARCHVRLFTRPASVVEEGRVVAQPTLPVELGSIAIKIRPQAGEVWTEN